MIRGNIELKLSIIIPVFNGEDCIERCVNSIEQNENYKRNLDVIIVDDGSTDRTYNIVERMARKYDNIRGFQKKNGGVSSARNFGLTVADGDYVLFIDADDTLSNSGLSLVMSEMQENIADYYMFPIEKEVKKGVFIRKDYSLSEVTIPVEDAYEYFYTDGNNGPWSKLFKMDIIRTNNLRFHENLKIHEDVIFCMEYLEHCKDVRYCKDVIYTYTLNELGAVQKHKVEYLDNYSTVYYLWISYLKRHSLEKYLDNLNQNFLHKMLTTSAKLAKHGMSINEIDQKLDSNRLFYEIKRTNYTGIKWKIEKQLLVHKKYYLISFKVK